MKEDVLLKLCADGKVAKVTHGGKECFAHSSYASSDGKRIVQIAPTQEAMRGDGIICQNVLVDDIEEVQGPGK